jgi:cell division protein FtsL
MSGRLTFVFAAILVLSALAVVNSYYRYRSLFIELGRAQSQARQLDIDWAQLQLDQSTLGKHARIEFIAQRQLHMVPVVPANTQYLTVGGKDAQ